MEVHVDQAGRDVAARGLHHTADPARTKVGADRGDPITNDPDVRGLVSA
jgi:hypothetical protein